MTIHIRRIVGFALIAVVVAQASGAMSATRSSQLAAACASCHRSDGRDTGIPPIVGLDENRIATSMLAYRSGEGGSQIMHVVATALSPDEIASIAHYLARQQTTAERP